MRILFIVPYVPNLIRVRPYNMIRYLTARGHEVTVLTLWSSEEERADAEALKEHCHGVVALPLPRCRSLWNCLRALPTSVPLQAVYCWQPALARAVNEMMSQQVSEVTRQQVNEAPRSTPSAAFPFPIDSLTRYPVDPLTRCPFDLIHIEHLRGARYGQAARRQTADNRPQTPVVWDSVDCISYLFGQAAQDSRSLSGRWMTRLELGRTRRYEGWLVNQFDRVLVTSKVDKLALEELCREGVGHGIHDTRSRMQDGPELSCILDRGSCIQVLPNGVDLDYFTPADEPRDPATLVISGKMSYHANVTAVLHLVNDIMPHVWAQRPDVPVWIVGKDPPREITKLKVQSLKFKVQISNPKSRIPNPKSM